MSRNRYLPLGSACLALVVLGTGATGADAVVPVSVESAGLTFTVKVAAPTPLRAALQALCDRAEASCKLPAGMPEALVEARTFRGSWPDVVAELLQGSGLRFGATPPAAGRNPYLIVEAPASAKPAPGGSSASTAASAPDAAPSDMSTSSTVAPPAVAEQAPAEEEAPVAEARDQPSATAADPEATLVTAASAAATPGARFAMTPFTDGKGNPLMARLPNPGSPSATPGMAVLPYVDEAGNPLTVPITNEPLSLTPFAGPDGQAWPAPVPQPNQKLEYPIPPTFPVPSKSEKQ